MKTGKIIPIIVALGLCSLLLAGNILADGTSATDMKTGMKKPMTVDMAKPMEAGMEKPVPADMAKPMEAGMGKPMAADMAEPMKEETKKMK